MDGYKVIYYVTLSGKVVFKQWLQGLRDIEAKVSILKRLNRLEQGPSRVVLEGLANEKRS